MPRLLCFGVGLTARTLARRLRAEGWELVGTSRSEEGCAALRAEGFTAWRFDGHQALPAAAWEGVSHVVSSVPPQATCPQGTGGDASYDPVLAHHADVLGDASRGLRWVGYLSSTAVYGDHQGGWVDEETPVSPDVPRGRWRVQAEQAWRQTTPAAHLFRLSGIYGPGRNALRQIAEGRARRIIKDNQWFCRIHVDDIASVLIASMARPFPGRVYNLSDDEPTAPEAPLLYASTLLGLPAPPPIAYTEADLPEVARGFYQDSRRVRNDRIKNELGVLLAYPTYREGLASLLRDFR